MVTACIEDCFFHCQGGEEDEEEGRRWRMEDVGAGGA